MQKKMPSPQISLHPHLILSHHVTSLPHLLLLPLHTYPYHTASSYSSTLLLQDFSFCCALCLEHSSPDMCISHPLPLLNTSADGTPSQPGLPDPPILNYSNPTPTPGTSYISFCFCFSPRHFLSSEMCAFYQCVTCLSPSIQ